MEINIKNLPLCLDSSVELAEQSLFFSNNKDIIAAWLERSCELALYSVQNGGGPFGAIILEVDFHTQRIGKIWQNHNHVVSYADPTAHAEISVIRVAAKELSFPEIGFYKRYDAFYSQEREKYTILFSSCEPCPMCMAASYWAKIKHLYFAATRFDAAAEGVNFSDKFIYDELARSYAERQKMHVVQYSPLNALDAFTYFTNNTVARYGQFE